MRKSFIVILLTVFILLLILVTAYIVFNHKPSSVLPESNRSKQTSQKNLENEPLPTLETTPSERAMQSLTPTEEDIKNLKTYQSAQFGFSFEYPSNLTTIASGPNEEQQRLDLGETISGSTEPTLDTITFSDQTDVQQFSVVIFPVKAIEISTEGFANYLSTGSACDTRWADSIDQGPMIIERKGIPVLEVQVSTNKEGKMINNGCYYFKNLAGNLVVFNIAGFEEKTAFFDIFDLVGNEILSTLNLMVL